MCDVSVKLVLSNYVLQHKLIFIFLQMRFLERSENLAKFFMTMYFVMKLVYTKVVGKL
jgi:hypothetical protein